MPAIHVRTGVSIPEETRARIQSELGKAIELLPGKSEQWLMCSFEPECPMCFGGSDAPCAFVSVMLYGTTDDAHSNRLTGAITELLHSALSIPPERIYVAYQEVKYWGYAGQNF